METADDVPDDEVVLAAAIPEEREVAFGPSQEDWDAGWAPLPTVAFFWCFFMQNVEQ